MNYREEENFINVHEGNNLLGAITDKGYLYLWGTSNILQKIFKRKSVDSPTKVNELSNLFLIQISIGTNHLTFIAYERNKNSSELKVFGMGSNSEGQIGSDLDESSLYKEIHILNNHEPYLIASSEDFSIICTKSKRSLEERDPKITNFQYFEKNKDGIIKKYRKGENLPKKCYATRYPIKELKSENWKDLDSYKIRNSNDPNSCSLCSIVDFQISFEDIRK